MAEQEKGHRNFEKEQKEENEAFNCEQEKNKEKTRTGDKAGGESVLPSASPSPQHLIPEFPASYESMAPPDCKPRVSSCTMCRSPVFGRVPDQTPRHGANTEEDVWGRMRRSCVYASY